MKTFVAENGDLRGNAAVTAALLGIKGGSNEALINEKGQINASSMQELFNLQAALMKAAANGSITEDNSVSAAQIQAQKQDLYTKLQAAYHNGHSNDFLIIGEGIEDSIRTTSQRAGFLRRFLKERTLKPGEVARTRIRENQVTAYSVGENSRIQESRHQGNYIYPESTTIGSRIKITEKSLAEEGFELLDERAEDGLESIMVKEDRNLIDLFNKASSATRNHHVVFPTLTPQILSTVRQVVENSGGLPVHDLLLANNLWSEIHGNSEFHHYLSPIEQHELVLSGRVAKMLDCDITTDAHLESKLRVVAPNDFYFLADADYLGELLVRQELTTSEIDGTDDGDAWRGWFIREILHYSLANIRGVARGSKR